MAGKRKRTASAQDCERQMKERKRGKEEEKQDDEEVTYEDQSDGEANTTVFAQPLGTRTTVVEQQRFMSTVKGTVSSSSSSSSSSAAAGSADTGVNESDDEGVRYVQETVRDVISWEQNDIDDIDGRLLNAILEELKNDSTFAKTLLEDLPNAVHNSESYCKIHGLLKEYANNPAKPINPQIFGINFCRLKVRGLSPHPVDRLWNFKEGPVKQQRMITMVISRFTNLHWDDAQQKCCWPVTLSTKPKDSDGKDNRLVLLSGASGSGKTVGLVMTPPPTIGGEVTVLIYLKAGDLHPVVRSETEGEKDNRFVCDVMGKILKHRKGVSGVKEAPRDIEPIEGTHACVAFDEMQDDLLRALLRCKDTICGVVARYFKHVSIACAGTGVMSTAVQTGTDLKQYAIVPIPLPIDIVEFATQLITGKSQDTAEMLFREGSLLYRMKDNRRLVRQAVELWEAISENTRSAFLAHFAKLCDWEKTPWNQDLFKKYPYELVGCKNSLDALDYFIAVSAIGEYKGRNALSDYDERELEEKLLKDLAMVFRFVPVNARNVSDASKTGLLEIALERREGGPGETGATKIFHFPDFDNVEPGKLTTWTASSAFWIRCGQSLSLATLVLMNECLPPPSSGPDHQWYGS